MSNSETLPPARERNRYGISPFHEKKSATARDALFDRVALRVRGHVTPLWQDAVRGFADGVGTSPSSPLFERVRREKGRWASKARSGTTISVAKLAVWDNVTFGRADLELVVNPMRTLGHLLDRYTYADVPNLTPTEFFEKRAAPTAKARTLDGSDNMVSDFLAFSGTVHTTRLQRVADYLQRFEAALAQRLIDDLCPVDLGFTTRSDGGNLIAENDHVRFELEWGSLTVSQCEACWEWHEPDALAKVHAIADAALTSARSTGVDFYDRPSVERDLGALAVTLPLPGDVALVVYAKAVDRLRVEVRYVIGLPQMVGDSLPSGPRTLNDWFDAVRNHAAARVPWDNLHRLLSPPPEPSVDALADLLAAFADATDSAKSKRQGLLRQLLRHGAVTATPPDGAAPLRVLKRLADRGVVEHVRLVSRDADIGRRFRLADRFMSVRVTG